MVSCVISVCVIINLNLWWLSVDVLWMKIVYHTLSLVASSVQRLWKKAPIWNPSAINSRATFLRTSMSSHPQCRAVDPAVDPEVRWSWKGSDLLFRTTVSGNNFLSYQENYVKPTYVILNKVYVLGIGWKTLSKAAVLNLFRLADHLTNFVSVRGPPKKFPYSLRKISDDLFCNFP